MDEVVSQLLSYKSLLLGIATFIVTFLIRRIVETAVPTAKKAADANAPGLTYLTPFARWWNEAILYVLPVVIGSLLSLGLKELALDAFTKVSTMIVYGGIVGWFSAILYKGVAQAIRKKTGIELPGASVSPPSDDPPPAV
jgi:hypothetical protein